MGGGKRHASQSRQTRISIHFALRSVSTVSKTRIFSNIRLHLSWLITRSIFIPRILQLLAVLSPMRHSDGIKSDTRMFVVSYGYCSCPHEATQKGSREPHV
jgi:hypothetical protein